MDQKNFGHFLCIYGQFPWIPDLGGLWLFSHKKKVTSWFLEEWSDPPVPIEKNCLFFCLLCMFSVLDFTFFAFLVQFAPICLRRTGLPAWRCCSPNTSARRWRKPSRASDTWFSSKRTFSFSPLLLLCVGPKISHPEHHCLDGGSDRGSAPVCIQQPLFGRKFFNCKLSIACSETLCPMNICHQTLDTGGG